MTATVTQLSGVAMGNGGNADHCETGAASYSEGSLFRTHKFRIPGGF